MCLTQSLMMNICALKTQCMFFENSSMHTEVMAWTSLDTRTHTQTLNSYFDNYVELSVSRLDKNPLTTKHNTSKHKQNTVRTSKFWYFSRDTPPHYGEHLAQVILKSRHACRMLRTRGLRRPPSVTFAFEWRTWFCEWHTTLSWWIFVSNYFMIRLHNSSKNEQDIDRINLDRRTDWRTHIHQTAKSEK
jgi:hypothetical protein